MKELWNGFIKLPKLLIILIKNLVNLIEKGFTSMNMEHIATYFIFCFIYLGSENS